MPDVRCPWCEQVTVTIPEGEEKAECPNCLWLVYRDHDTLCECGHFASAHSENACSECSACRGHITPAERRESALFNATLDLISRQWPYRGDYFGVRLTLRSLVRHAKHLRDQL